MISMVHNPFARLAALTLVLTLLGVVVGGADRIALTNILIIVAFAYSWNLVGGLLGELSFAHTVFFGIGVYAIVLGELHGWPMPVVFVVAPLLSIGVGLVVVVLGAAARLDGLSWFVATLVLSMIVAGVVAEIGALGKSEGLIMPLLPWAPGGLVGASIALMAGAALVNMLVIRARAGRRWIAIRDEPVAAEAHGIGVVRERLLAYGVSAPIASLAGVLQGLVIGYASPSVSLGVGPLVLVVLGVYIGGPGTMWGPLLGVALLQGIGVVVQRTWDDPDLAEYSRVLQYALAFALVLFAFNRRRRAAERSERSLVDIDAVAVMSRSSAVGETSVLEVRDVSKSYGGVGVLADVDVALTSGTVVALVGPNGAGKTTLLNMIAGQGQPSAGHIVVDGRDITTTTVVRRSRLIRRGFQTARVFSGLSIVDNVRVGTRLSAPDARSLITSLGVGDPDKSAAVSEVGERRMVELAWAAAGRQTWLLFDEPLAGLDETEVAVVLRMLRRAAEAGAGVLVVEHRLAEIVGHLDRIVVLDLGVVIADGPPEVVLRDPNVVDAYLGTSTALEVVQ